MDPLHVDRFDSRRSTVYGSDGLVATSQPLAAAAGVALLRAGGNAFDAAVGAAAALNVVEPTSTGLGGDVFAAYRTADGTVGGMQACGAAPAAAGHEALRRLLARQLDGDPDPETVTMPDRGGHTVTVPGTPGGWEALVERFGRLPLADVVEPAVGYATDGYPVTEVVARQWQAAADALYNDPARESYLFDGEPPSAGQTVRLPRLGETLRRFGREGSGGVYDGPVADAVVDTVRQYGGVLTHDDLAAFEVSWPDPISTTYGTAEVFELPPYNAGMIALEALNVAEAVGVGDHDDPARTHYLAEAARLAFTDGLAQIADPRFETVPSLHDPSFAATRAAEITDRAATAPSVATPDTGAREDTDTVLVCVGDSEGNLVSLINSVFWDFGSGLVAGDTGVVLHNRGSAFSLDPSDPNRLEPGKKPFHGLLPAVCRLGDDDWAAFGVMGGYMQPQGHLQVVSNLVDRGLGLQPAVDAARFRYRADGELWVEERLPDGVATDLARRGHDVRVQPASSFGGAQIVRNDGGTLAAATEPRKDGHVGVV